MKTVQKRSGLFEEDKSINNIVKESRSKENENVSFSFDNFIKDTTGSTETHDFTKDKIIIENKSSPSIIRNKDILVSKNPRSSKSNSQVSSKKNNEVIDEKIKNDADEVLKIYNETNIDNKISWKKST